jgi:tRNA dimethylallyltransferase
MTDPRGTLIVICGPTAIGKTAIAIELASDLNTEIISCDSRQFYKELKIGVARPEETELSAVRHHFIGFLSIHDTYNAYRYETDSLACLNSLFTDHATVVAAGGSGLYIQALCEGIDLLPDPDPSLRDALKNLFESQGIQAIRNDLKRLDPGYYGSVDLNNPKRILRALEVSISTGKPYSSFRTNKKHPRPFRIIKIGMNTDRPVLYKRIDNRVDLMIAGGLIEEARGLYAFRHLNALNTVGYKELFGHFDGQSTLEQAVEKIKTHTRQYAKRQLTWFSKDDEIKWFEPTERKGIKKFIAGLTLT